MKLLIGLSYYSPNISGLTFYAKALAEELCIKGFDVEILTSRYAENLEKNQSINGVKVKRLWTPQLLGRGPIMPLYPISVILEVFRSDVVNVHLPSFEAVFLCLWAKVFGKKIVTTYHCDLANWPGLLNKATELAANISHFITLCLSDVIVNSSQDYAKNSYLLKLFLKKTRFVYPPVRIIKSDNKPLAKWQKTKYKIGFVGRVAAEKGVEYLLKSIVLLKAKLGEDFKIFFVGPTDSIIGGGNYDSLKVLFIKYRKYIEVLGKMSDKDLFGFYKQIDVLVLPSVASLEAFGMVQVEAMLSGCPVVVTDLPGVRIPVVKTGMGKVVEPKNALSLAEGIAGVLKNKEKFLTGKSLAEDIFSYHKVIDFYEKLFKNIS